MRLQGGTLGILSAIDAGRLDELCPDLPDEHRRFAHMTAKEQRRIRAIEERRVADYRARLANRSRF